ncbi:MAG: hypothetical protein KC466_16700, partial [Myxococcales bacterium]|nr:hypothetical protein [Myxococcales bacterium]
LGANVLPQLEWDPWSRRVPAVDDGVRAFPALVITGASPADACAQARRRGWVEREGDCARTAARGALRAQWGPSAAWTIAATR